MASENLDPTKHDLKSGLKALEKTKGRELHQLREMLLMQLVTSLVIRVDDADSLIRAFLEVVIPVLGNSGGFCYSVDGTELLPMGSYFPDHEIPDPRTDATISQKIASVLSNGPAVIRKNDPLFEDIRFSPGLSEQPRRIALFPFETLKIPLGVFILMETQKKKDSFTDHYDVLQRITGLFAEKLDKIGLSAELKQLNREFEKQVESRVEKLMKRLEEGNSRAREKTIADPDPSGKPEKIPATDPTAGSYLKNIGVEIRTPLNGILGFAELLRENATDKESREKYIDIIKSCGKSLMKIVDDARTFAYIQSGKSETRKDEFLLAPFITELYDIYKKDELFKQRDKVELKINININGNTHIVTDREKLKLILTNLISNAIKFTDSGTIEFGCTFQEGKKRQQAKPVRHNILFFVRDTGVGIEEEYKPHIFDEFYKVEHEISQLYGGLGLGLTIAKTLVEELGGKLEFSSKSGIGSEFYFVVPNVIRTLNGEPGANNGVEPDYNWEGKKFLIVEDDAMSLVFLREALKSTGAKITQTTNGRDAVDLITGGKKFDVVLMDIKLPGMSGYEATRQIKALTDIPVLAQTAYAMSDDYKKILQAGCDDYISKPINRKKLLQKIDSLLSGTRQAVL